MYLDASDGGLVLAMCTELTELSSDPYSIWPLDGALASVKHRQSPGADQTISKQREIVKFISSQTLI